MENDISSPSPSARRRWLRWSLLGAAVAAAIAVVVYRSVTFVNQPPQQQGRRRFQEGNNQPVGVAHIDRGDIRLTVRALGAVTPLATVTVTTQISGYLMSVGFKEGQLVKKGQLLA
jgi:multidrug efflux system membrane fusion protein